MNKSEVVVSKHVATRIIPESKGDSYIQLEYFSLVSFVQQFLEENKRMKH